MEQTATWFSHYLRLADAVVITDEHHIVLEVNEAYERIAGYFAKEVRGLRAGFFKSHMTPSSTFNQLKQTLKEGRSWSGVFINRKKNGDLWHSSMTITPIEQDGNVYYVGIFRELEQLREGTYISRRKILQLRTELLRVLAISCEIQDPGIEDHLKRVQKLTKKLVFFHNQRCRLGLSEEYMEHVANSSILHDIGKAGIPEGILYKPGSLSHYERMIIETHPLVGVDIFNKISKEFETDLLQEHHEITRNIILHHHEKWDGSGYPSRLKGQEIPFEARVVSVIDVFDALTCRRAYKEAWPVEKALSFIQEQKGVFFEPEIVDSFIQLRHQLKIAETPF
ncbi:HD domain-containing phosphohydrolase [Ammoniphilus sp. 3BR4]|uniref:HD domain-containing phosphohydrolase n=1 Tax=Ammoniphilus sp. 3BR4 TaxID=3158265 RepID=UPI003466F51D